jgi:hypothetical protein
MYHLSSTNILTQLTSAQLILVNDETNGGYQVNGQNDSGKLVVIFPEKRDLDAYFASVPDGNTYLTLVEVSTNSTNGIDGTWTAVALQAAASFHGVGINPAYRTGIQGVTALAVKAVRFSTSSGAPSSGASLSVHLFGEISPGQNPNRLALWHPTLDQRIVPAYFDWGDVPRSSSADRAFRVKNLSGSLTANSIRVAMDILTDATGGAPSVAAQHSLSTDGTTFTAQVNVGGLAPGAISAGQVTLRRNTPSNAQLGLFAHRVFAEANSWS